MTMHKKTIVIAFVISVFIASALTGMQVVEAGSKIITVPDDYSSIQVAIDNAVDGDTIYVKKGVYVENPVVNKSISLVGEDRDATVIDVTAGLKVESNNVTITGFTIYNGWRGISLSGNQCSISGNKITDATNGIVLFGCENSSITENVFQSIGLSSAIQLNIANRNLVKNNYIDSCVEGIQIWQYSNNNTVSENTITSCQDTAINFQYSNDNTIIGNNISRSGLGTIIYGSNRNIISNNNYAYNVVQFDASETYYLTFGHNRSVNTIDGNYWSDYTARYPNAKEIEMSGFYNLFWDTPYNIGESLGNYTDSHPLINPISTSPISTPTPTSTSSPISTSTLSPSPSQTIEPSPSIPEFPAWIVVPLVFASALLTIYWRKGNKR